MFTTRQVAILVGCAHSTVRWNICRGRLRARVVGPPRSDYLRVELVEILNWLARRWR